MARRTVRPDNHVIAHFPRRGPGRPPNRGIQAATEPTPSPDEEEEEDDEEEDDDPQPDKEDSDKQQAPPVTAAEDPGQPDCFQDVPVIENGKRSKLTMPMRRVSPLQHDPGRGMMPTDGSYDPVYSRWVEGLDMDELRMALAKDNSPKALQFLSRLANPLFATVDIVTLAKRCSIGLTDMMQIWRSHKLTGAVQVMVDAAPELAAHAVEDAKSQRGCCKRCDGAGTIRVTTERGYRWIPCMVCEGKGAINVVGDHKSRELVFRVTGLVKNEAASVNVQINNTHSVASVLDELDHLDKDSVTIESK